MEKRRIMLNSSSHKQLTALVESLRRTGKIEQPHFLRLARELDDAIIVNSSNIPLNTVTIGSQVTIRYLPPTAEKQEKVRIVFPADMNLSVENISILSPLGLALIGEREGTEVAYEAPGGNFSLFIESVKPPEPTA